ncbi:putative C6 transcription factor [Aspergillus homomorphus CBS 101889]|uniref:C6 transcription factor n=1 Tax=Aspergillus homomorphus (strain CBS 101889) TaxID=1450537 RepID=A0A395I1E7_ASPHC|nr:C6 transcription factor [Aspergillus homomorphus CBS 101889]RAL13747.1 C6 transcription factor [Aspergillus homomorphus CBS 101889]
MSDNSRPPPFLPSFQASSFSELPENDIPLDSGGASLRAQQSQGLRGPHEAVNSVFSEHSTAGLEVIAGDRAGSSKVKIPRLNLPTTWTTSGRVSRACENCREQKAKCSGHRPTCQRCQEAGIRCSYGDRKREKMAKQLNDLTSQVKAYEDLLRGLSPKLDSESAKQVEQVLTEQSVDEDLSSQFQVATPTTAPVMHGDSGTSLTSAFSRNALDSTSEDFDRQAMGFVGEHSEIAWLYRLKRLVQRSNSVPKKSRDGDSIASTSFYLDDSKIPYLNDVDPIQRPPLAVAEQLLRTYFKVVHPSFPIVRKSHIITQITRYYDPDSAGPPRKWLAMLNLIFAIAARYTHSLCNVAEISPDDSVVYFSRALKLGVMGTVLLDHPDAQQVQVEGLTSFYLMSVGQVNRSWKVCGYAIRSALTLGLHLRNESSVRNVTKETKYTVWWSLYLLDCSLCVITGRPPSVSDDFCTTPLPAPFIEEEFDDEQDLIAHLKVRDTLVKAICPGNPQNFADTGSPEISRFQAPSPGSQCEQDVAGIVESLTSTPNSALVFLYTVDLATIIHESIGILYAPGVARKPWREIEGAISALNSKADAWLTRLPTTLHLSQGAGAFQRERVNLAFSFYSAKILITQPCLSRISQKTDGNDSPGGFCEMMAMMCIESANQMLELLPDSPDLAWVYRVSPWWYLLHYLMQSITVLLHGLLLLTKPGSAAYRNVLDRVQKSSRWLTEMSLEDPSSERAWLVCGELISEHVPELKN